MSSDARAGETFLGLDIGTSSVKALLIDIDQRIVADVSVPLSLSRPHPLWSEQNPQDWVEGVEAAAAAIRRHAPQAFARLAAIGLSGQMHGATLLDAGDAPLRPAILWNDGRAFAECAELEAPRARLSPPRRQHRDARLHRAQGALGRRARAARSSPRRPAFCCPRISFACACPAKRSRTCRTPRARSGSTSRIAAGTTICSRRAGSSARTCRASSRARRSRPCFRRASRAPGASRDERIPIAGGAGDNAASAVGVGAIQPGAGFVSLGTSGVIFSVTDRFVSLPERTLHAFCHALPERWHGMAVMLSAASALSWIASALGRAGDIGGCVDAAEAFARSPEAVAAAPIFLPYLSGERTPHNDAAATGLFAGLRGRARRRRAGLRGARGRRLRLRRRRRRAAPRPARRRASPCWWAAARVPVSGAR